MNWYVIYVKPRSEEAVGRLLRRAGIDSLTPKIKVKKFVRTKYSDVIEPLFPNYIFAFFDPQKQLHMISYTRGVRYVVGRESPLPVPDELIEAIMERTRGGLVSTEDETLEYGDRVRIKDGPFKDFLGVFQRSIPGKARAMILLDALHCSLDIEREALRKV